MSKTAKKKVLETPVPLALVEHNPSRQAHVDLSEVHLPPWSSPREPVKPDQVAGLARTMERFGLLQPIVVLPNPDEKRGGYMLLAGHRRVAAARSLGWRTLPAHVLARPAGADSQDGSLEHLLRSVALVENGQREDLDPLRDCEVVEELLRERGATLEGVAAELGRSRSWVARRARLRGLGAAARKAARSGGSLERWPTAWLELLALLPEVEQDILVAQQRETGYFRLEDLGTLRDVVRGRLKRLGTAPWDLSEEALAPEAGPCISCAKHTGAQSDLFDDPRKAELKDAQCLDAACWDLKKAAWRARSVAAARAKHGEALVVIEDPRHRFVPIPAAPGRVCDVLDDLQELLVGTEKPEKPRRGSPTVWAPDQVAKSKRGEEGAVPALVVTGPKAGQAEWVRLGAPLANGKVAPPRAATKPKDLAQRREQLAERRRKHVVLAFRELLDGWITRNLELPQALQGVSSDADAQLDLVGAWGCEPDLILTPKKISSGDHRTATLDDRAGRSERVLYGVLKVWHRELRGWMQLPSSSPVDPYHSEVLAMCTATRQQELLRDLALDAEAALPEPKSWAKEDSGTRTEAASTPSARGRRGVDAKSPGAAHEVSCRVCGFVDAESDSRSEANWVEPDLCAACAGTPGVGKKKGAKKRPSKKAPARDARRG